MVTAFFYIEIFFLKTLQIKPGRQQNVRYTLANKCSVTLRNVKDRQIYIYNVY